MTAHFNCLVMGAAGRDFHDYCTFFRKHPEFRVRAFTAAQIPFIETRTFPAQLAGSAEDADIPIFAEQRLPELIQRFSIDFVFLAYSDLPHEEVMHKASLVQSCGASFVLLGPRHTQLESTRPVIAVTAVRTGAGKSPLSQHVARHLAASGRSVAILRHPMPYGDLTRQRVERLTTRADLDRFDCTIEEREEYEPYLEQRLVVYAGWDYDQILSAAEAEHDVILWDGGNNDLAFVRPGLLIVVADALRPGHEVSYYPGETNLRSANVIVINKVERASPGDVEGIRQHVQALNPAAQVVEADLVVSLDDPHAVSGRRVLVVEDGPTLTHGGMPSGAGLLAAGRFAAREVIDPRPFAVGSIARTLKEYPHIGDVLPALGYSADQREELQQTINASGAEVVIDASPAGLKRCLHIALPVVRVRYRFEQRTGPSLEQMVDEFLRAASQ